MSAKSRKGAGGKGRKSSPRKGEKQTDRLRQMLSEKEVSMQLSISRSGLRLLVQKKQFPSPVQLSERRIAFFEDEVVAWQKARNLSIW